MIGTILGILGIIITLGFGGYSIWVYKKSKKKVNPASKQFFRKQSHFPVEPENAQNKAKLLFSCSRFSTITFSNVRIF